MVIRLNATDDDCGDLQEGLSSVATLKVMSLFGTRPEAIKMAPVIAEIARHPKLESVVCFTAQHRSLVDRELEMFGIVPDYDLDVMRQNQNPLQVAARVLDGLGPILELEKPDWLIVQGDTTSAMIGALAAFSYRVRVAHVEAGLRTFDIANPFPEEANRRVISIFADIHFAPTKVARQNLLREGVSSEAIRLTGNTGIDALQEIAQRPYNWDDGPLREIPRDRRIILLTTHRRESWGEPLESICRAVRTIATSMDNVHIVCPVHPNPNVYTTVQKILGDCSNVTLLQPLDYKDLVHLMSASYLVLTDSGGLQEEAPTFGKPVLVLREDTERPEGIEAGVARLVGTDRERIEKEVTRLLVDETAYEEMAHSVSPYGDGKASRRIVNALVGVPAVNTLIR